MLDLIATSTFGLEAVVKRELAKLGYEGQATQTGRIHFKGDESAICRSNLWLRTADRVLLQIGTFTARDFGELFDQTKSLPWEQWITPDAAFPVDGRSVKSQLSSVPACQKAVKKAIAEKLQAAHGVSELPETGPTYKVEVALLKDEVTLTIDTTGAGLHKRGYRPVVGGAPLRETLAAALVMLSFWREDRPLIDPFCGTGTIPIEAALIGRNIAPGINRSFASDTWPQLSDAIWEQALTEARDLAKPDMPTRIIGTDIDGEALKHARYHATKAGVIDQIHFQKRAFADIASKLDYGCMITNPPWGKRLGEQAELESLYASFPDVLRSLPTWSFYFFTAHEDFEKIIGQQADRRRKLYHASVKCTYYQIHGPNPGTPGSEHEPDSKPAFGGISPKARDQAGIFRNRLSKMARHLRRWPTKRGITCYRLYDRDVPEVPLVVDRYEDRLHIAEYERPHERTVAQNTDWLELMASTAAEVMDIPRGNVFVKQRLRQRGLTQHEKVASDENMFQVNEGGLKFLVNLSDYIDTGLFLDHRITRSMFRDEAKDKRVLNLFGYTGAFTVYAAAGGAASSLTVDASNTYLDWALQNMTLNGLAGKNHSGLKKDAMAFIHKHEPGEHYDLAIVDPPTFSNSKSTDEDWEVQRDYVELLNGLRPLMSSNGVIYFSTNFRRMKFDVESLNGFEGREISNKTVPEDFRNKRIHRCWRMMCTELSPVNS